MPKTFFAFSFLVLSGTLGWICVAIDFAIFTKYEDLGGFTCSTDQAIFDVEDVRSLEHCVFKCSVTSNCYGVFHQFQHMRCVGCHDHFLTQDKALLLNGTVYYRRQSTSYKVDTEKRDWNMARDTLIASDVENEGNFLWRDGTRVSDHYFNWAPRQPNNVNGDEHCVMTSGDAWEWRDTNCSLKKYSLCKFD